MRSAPDKSTIIREFDAKAPTYDDGTHSDMYHAHNDFIMALMDVGPSDRVLDIGCAGGYTLRSLARAHPGLGGLGVDLAPRMVEQARTQTLQEGLETLEYLCCDWEDPSTELTAALAPGTMTQAVCASALHYFTDPAGAIRRIHDALAPGGVLYILERRLNGSPVNLLWNLLHEYVLRDHVIYYYDRQIIAFCRNAGFVEAERVKTVRKFLWNNKLYTDLSIFRAVKAQGHQA